MLVLQNQKIFIINLEKIKARLAEKNNWLVNIGSLQLESKITFSTVMPAAGRTNPLKQFQLVGKDWGRFLAEWTTRQLSQLYPPPLFHWKRAAYAKECITLSAHMWFCFFLIIKRQSFKSNVQTLFSGFSILQQAVNWQSTSVKYTIVQVSFPAYIVLSNSCVSRS